MSCMRFRARKLACSSWQRADTSPAVRSTITLPSKTANALKCSGGTRESITDSTESMWGAGNWWEKSTLEARTRFQGPNLMPGEHGLGSLVGFPVGVDDQLRGFTGLLRPSLDELGCLQGVSHGCAPHDMRRWSCLLPE